VALVEGDQPAGGVEDVDGGGVAAVGVAHGVGEDRRQAGLAGEREGAGGVDGGARSPVALPAGEPVADQLEQEVLRGDHLAPGRQRGAGEVVATAGDRGPDRRGGTEQHHHVSPGQVGGEQVEGGQRPAALAGEVDLGDQPADRGPAGGPTARPAGVGEQRHPGRATPLRGQVAVGAAAHRAAGPRRARAPGSPGLLGAREGEVHAEHRPDPGLLAGRGELDRAVGAVAVGEREGVHLLLDGALDQRLRVGGAVLEGVPGGDVEVDERVRRHRTGPARPAP
jgi:hypothetical protein